MKFISVLIKEGRKEDLRNKYIKGMDPEVLDWILNISDLEDFNHKYTDFVLRTLNRDSEDLDMDVEVAVQLIQDFDKYQSQLEKKDINQYKSIIELENSLKPVLEKEKQRKLEKQVRKIYEDDKFLVVEPESEEASCKYGSNTKWCVTSKGSGHFGRYTSGKQKLYFIINKQNSTNKNYSKVAIHFDGNGDPRYWDSQDSPMSDREVSILKYAFPEMISAIEEDYKKFSITSTDVFLEGVFNNYSTTVRPIVNFLSTDSIVEVIFKGFETVNDVGPGHAQGVTKIYLDKALIDSYQTFITFKAINNENLSISVGFMGDEPDEDQKFIDTGLEDWGVDAKVIIRGEVEIFAGSIRNYIASRVADKVRESEKLKLKLLGTSKVWNPNRGSYGYTFKSADKGLVKKLVDWLDSSKIGTKLDFLSDIGKLDKKIEQGKPLYSFPNKNKFDSPTRWRGQFSSFFASAKNAGILGYRKVGKEYFLIKGPNFEAFKEGKLRAL